MEVQCIFSAKQFSLAFSGTKEVLDSLEAWLRKMLVLICFGPILGLDHLHAERAPAKAHPKLTPGRESSRRRRRRRPSVVDHTMGEWNGEWDAAAAAVAVSFSLFYDTAAASTVAH